MQVNRTKFINTVNAVQIIYNLHKIFVKEFY